MNVRLPRLFSTHPGYAKVAAKLILVHLGFGLIVLLIGKDEAPIFAGVRAVAPHQAWAALHFTVATLAVVGLYWRFILARCAWLLSLVIFNAYGVALLLTSVGLLHSGDSTRGGVGLLMALLIVGESGDSWATLLEPEVNPAYRGHE